MNQLVRVSAVCLALAAVACSKEAPEETETDATVPVTTAPATQGDIIGHIHATGFVTAAPGAELIVVAPESARIAEIPKAEGDTVRRGDVLVRFEIPSTTAEAAKQHAEIGRDQARLTTAQATEARQKDLVDRGVGARKDLEEATRAVADAQADLAAAQAAAIAADTVASRSVVRATFDGVVAKRSHNPGDLVEASASDAVLRIIDPRRIEVTAQVPLGDVARIRVGAPARVVSPATEAAAPALTVVSRPAAAQEGTPAVPIRLAFKVPPRYPVGSPVEVEIEAERHRGVVLIPIAGLVHEGEDAAVFVANGGKAERRKVMVGLEDEEHAEISSGVKPGEAVIVTNTNGLSDEAKISTGEAKTGTDAGKADKDDQPEKDEK